MRWNFNAFYLTVGAGRTYGEKAAAQQERFFLLEAQVRGEGRRLTWANESVWEGVVTANLGVRMETAVKRARFSSVSRNRSCRRGFTWTGRRLKRGTISTRAGPDVPADLRLAGFNRSLSSWHVAVGACCSPLVPASRPVAPS